MFSEPYKHSGVKRRGINSVEQGVSVLQAVVTLGQASSLKDIARTARLDSSQAHRYVSSLVNCGMLRQDALTGLYDLGPTALRTGMAALARQDPIQEVDTCAAELARVSGATVLVSIWAPSGPTVIRWYHGMPPVYTILTIGSVLPLRTSATGRVFMGFLPDRLLSDVLKRDGFKGSVGKSPELRADRDRVRAEHIAGVEGTLIPGLRAYSCPVLAVDQRLVAAITVLASDAIDRSIDESYKARLLSACEATSHKLCGAWMGR